MWTITDRILADDSSAAVLNALVVALPGMTLPEGDLERLQRAIRSAFARAEEDRAGADDLRETCLKSMTNLHVMRGAEDAAGFVNDFILNGLMDHPKRALAVVHLLRDALTFGDVEPPSPENAAIRRRAIDLAERLFEQASATFRSWNEALAGKQLEPDDPRLLSARATAQVLDGIASEFYFATGIFQKSQGEEPTVSQAQRERLYAEASTLLDQLCDVGFAASTHRVLGALEGFIALDPRGVFLRIARTVKAGQAGGYHGDSLGAALVVRLVERYLAEHRTLLQQDDECRRALVEILDIFVRAGWPAALSLTYGLQDIFR
jgi:hypothetical protein